MQGQVRINFSLYDWSSLLSLKHRHTSSALIWIFQTHWHWYKRCFNVFFSFLHNQKWNDSGTRQSSNVGATVRGCQADHLKPSLSRWQRPPIALDFDLGAGECFPCGADSDTRSEMLARALHNRDSEVGVKSYLFLNHFSLINLETAIVVFFLSCDYGKNEFANIFFYTVTWTNGNGWILIWILTHAFCLQFDSFFEVHRRLKLSGSYKQPFKHIVKTNIQCWQEDFCWVQFIYSIVITEIKYFEVTRFLSLDLF